MAEYLEKRVAVLTPKRTDDLAEGVAEWVGKSFAVQHTGAVEEGPYAGQPGWTPHGGPVVAWIPECDLTFA